MTTKAQTTETTWGGVLATLTELADEFDRLGGKLAEIEQAARQAVEVRESAEMVGVAVNRWRWDCPCGFYGPATERAHDWLLGLEDRGLPGFVELITRFQLSLDREASEEEELKFTWDLPDFVARHRWRDPAAMHRLARYVVDAEQQRLGPVIPGGPPPA